jgi:hypothetical protein
MIAAANGWLMCFDNLDHIAPWLSNAFCRLSTGGGFATRRQYTDDGEMLFDASRPILVNGIEELATRGDLLDRAIIIQLPAIQERDRRPESAFWREFRRAQPAILGSLLDALGRALAIVAGVRLAQLPRMADFMHFGIAVERALNWPAGAFLDAYTRNRHAGHALSLEESVVAGALYAFVARTGTWTGTASELLGALARQVDESIRRRRDWPKTPTALSGQLRRLAPTLRGVGVNVVFDRTGQFRRITVKPIQRAAEASSPSSASSK